MKPWKSKQFRSPGPLLSRLHIGSELDNWVAQEEGRFLTEEGLAIVSQASQGHSENGWAYLDNVLPGKGLRHNLHEITVEIHNPNRKDSVSGSWDPHGSDMHHGARGGANGEETGVRGRKGGGSQTTTLPALYKRSVNHIKFAPRQKVPIWIRLSLGKKTVCIDKV